MSDPCFDRLSGRLYRASALDRPRCRGAGRRLAAGRAQELSDRADALSLPPGKREDRRWLDPELGSQIADEDSSNPLPKIVALRGSLHIEWKRCGRSNCRCRQGHLHGPYYARHWREGGRQRKAYVPAADLPATLLAIEARREVIPPASRMIAIIESAIKSGLD